jgi:hypothetical protein
VETPLPIPNRAVKHRSADGTWGATPWESRSPPVFLRRAHFAPSGVGWAFFVPSWAGMGFVIRKGPAEALVTESRIDCRRRAWPCLRTDRCPQGWAQGEVAPQAAQSGTIRGVRSAPITVTLGIRSACPFRGEGRRPSAAEAASPGSVHRAREPEPDPARAGLEERVSAAVGASQGRMSLLFLVCSEGGRNPYSPRVVNSTARSSPSAARSWRFLNTNIGS